MANAIFAGFRVVFFAVALTGVFLYTRVGTHEFAAQQVEAATSDELNFQARLFDASGNIVDDGTYNIEFKIYDSAAAGASAQGACVGGGTDDCQWVETRTGGNQVTIKNGYFSVRLGEVTPFGSSIQWDQDLYLTMNIGGTGAASWDGEMTPRIKLTSVPYAQAAGQLVQTSGADRGTLNFAGLTNNPNLLLPDIASGTLLSDQILTTRGDLMYRDASSTTRLALGSANTCLRSDGTDAAWGSCTGTGDVIQNGNSFGTAMVIGSNDPHDLELEAGGTTRLTIDDASGNVTLTSDLAVNGGDITSTGALNITPGGALTVGDYGHNSNLRGDITTVFSDSILGLGSNAVEQIILLGNSTTATSVTVSAGTGGIAIGNNGIANNIQIGNTTGAVAQSINIGNNATASSTSTVTIGSTIGASTTTIQAGSGNINLTGNADISGTLFVGTGNAFQVSTGGIVTYVNGAASNDSVVCRNASGELAGCNSTFLTSANAFIQNGNSFNANAVLGTNDAYSLIFEVGGVSAVTIADEGAITFQNETDSTSAFQVLDANGGDPVFNVDTINNRVGIGTAAPSAALNVHNGTFNISGSLTSGQASFYINQTIATDNANIYGFQNSQLYQPGASASNYYGLLNDPRLDSSANNIDNFHSAYSRLQTSATYSGSITNGYAFRAAAPNILGSTIANYYGLRVNDPSLNDGNTSGTISNIGVSVDGFTAAAGAGGTVRNVGIRIAQPTGSGAGTTYNTALLIGASTVDGNYAIYNGSTSDNLFGGSLIFSGVATDITTGTNENLTIIANGTGQIILNDTVQIGTLAAADNDAVVCRNTSNQLATCTSTFATTTQFDTAFIQNGNSFTANAVLGTNDAYSLILETNDTTALTIDTSQNATFAGKVTTGTDGLAFSNNANSSVFATGTTTAIAYDTNSISLTSSAALFNSRINLVNTGSAAIPAISIGFLDADTGFYSSSSGQFSFSSDSTEALQFTSTGLGTPLATASLFNANATTVNAFGAATSINLGAAGATITGGGALTIRSGGTNTALTLQSNGTGAVSLDSGTTGAINIGSGANAKTITIGNGTGATSLILNAGTGAINIGTNTVARTISIGNTTGASVLNLNSGTGALSINSTTGTINIGSTGSARSVNLGTGAAAQTVTVGSTNTTSSTTIQSGTGALTINSGTGTINVGSSASARTVNIGTGAAAQTVTVGSTNTTSATTIQAGSGGINLTGNVDVSGTLFVGTSDAFQVSASGAVTAVGVDGGTGLLQGTGGLSIEGTVTFSSLTSCSTIQTDGSGELSCGGTSGGVTVVGNIDSQVKSANGAVISGSTIYLQTADDSNPGLVSTSSQTFAGDKTFNGSVTLAASQTLRLTGDTTANRPAGVAGELYYDTDTNQLLVYNGTKWVAQNGSTYTTVAASNSSAEHQAIADYIADGTSDEDEINSALTAAAGGKVYLFPGTFTIDESIFMPNNTTLSGAGRGTLVQMAAVATSFDLIENTDTTTGTGITIRDLALDGAGSTGGTQSGIKLDAAETKIIEVRVTNFTEFGMELNSDSDHSVIRGNYFSGNDDDAIYLDGAGGALIGVVIEGNSFEGNNDVGINALAVDESVITGNVFNLTNNRAIYLNSSDQNIVSNNMIDDTNNISIDIRNSDQNIIKGNSIEDSTDEGILIDDTSSDNIINGNRIVDSGGSTANDAIYLGALDADANQITNNYISDDSCTTTCYAINIADASIDDTYLADNILGGGSINDAGTGTIYGGQVSNASGDFTIQPAGNINLNSDTIVSSGNLTVGDATNVGNLILSDGSSNFLTLNVDALAGDYTLSVPTITANDTFCLVTLNNCNNVNAFVQNGNSFTANAVLGTNDNYSLSFETNDTIALTIDTSQNATFNGSVTLAANQSLRITGGATASRPASPEAGMLFYDTTTNSLITYNGTKWVAARGDYIIVASNHGVNPSTQAERDAADYVTDGTSDEDEINSALAAAAGGKVVLLGGTYVADGTILVPNNTTLSGVGYGTEIEFADIDTTDSLIENSDTTTGTGVVIRDIKLDGRDDLNTAGFQTGIDLNGMGDASADRAGALITGVYGERFSAEVVALDGADNNTVTDSFLVDNLEGVYLTGAAAHNLITGNTFVGNSNGVHAQNSTTHTTITGNNFEDGDTGIFLNNADFTTVTNNTMYSTNAYGVRLNSADDNLISSNNISDPDGAADFDAIRLNGSDRNQIINNKLSDTECNTTCYGISIADATSDENYVSGNVISETDGDDSWAINDSGTGTIIAGQVMSESTGDFTIQPAGDINLGADTNVSGVLNVATGVASGSYAATIQNTTASGEIIQGLNHNGNKIFSIDTDGTGNGVFLLGDNAGGTTEFSFWTANADSYIDVQNRAFGIGTTSPAGKLEVDTDDNENLTALVVDQGDTVNNNIALDIQNAGTGNSLQINTSQFVVSGSGRVGIGTNAPSADLTFGDGANRTINVLTRTSNAAGRNLTVVAGAAGSGGSAFSGGTLSLQGGAAAGTGNANGGDVILTGGTGTGTGVLGTVQLAPTRFEAATVQNFTGSANITQANIDTKSTILISSNASGYTATLTDPSITTAGRLLYVTNTGIYDMVLSANGGGSGNTVTLKPNTSATMIWNGVDWTAAGASSSTDLQAAYNNTATSAGGAELVLNASGGAADGLTIRNNPDTPINGGILEVQTSIGTNLFSVNNLGSELAANGGSESAAGWATDWTAVGAATASRTTTAGQYITGQAAAQIVTPATANTGIRNNLTANPVVSTTYQVSFAAKLSSGTFSTLQVAYSRDGGTDIETCTNYSTQTLSTTEWTKVTCTVTTDSTTATNPDLIIRQTDATARTFWIENLSFVRNDGTTEPSHVQIGGGITGGQVTLFTLDRSSAPPVANGNETYLGSMYYDTTSGRIQCYEADGWGACGSAPNNYVNLVPEYPGSVLNGDGVGTMSADFCANESGILAVNTSFCSDGESKNYYNWTSPQSTQQTYSIYITYQLPAAFKAFESNDTVTLTARTDNTTNGIVTYEMFRNEAGEIFACGSETTVTTIADTWQTVGINGNEATGCGFSLSTADDFVIFKINMKASNNANVYASTLSFTSIGQ